MSIEEKHEKIDSYLSGALSGAELEAFEQQLQLDEALAKEVRLSRNLDPAIEDKAALNFQKLVQEEGRLFLEEEETKNSSTPRLNSTKYSNWAIAATILVLVVCSAILWKSSFKSQPSGAELFAQNFETYTLTLETRSGDATASDFDQGIKQYQAGDFLAASQTFETLVATSKDDMVLAFSLAHAYLNQSPPQLEAAQKQLQTIIEEGNSIYVPRAQWYLALTLLRQEHTSEATPLLQSVAKSADNYGTKAKALLEKLD